MCLCHDSVAASVDQRKDLHRKILKNKIKVKDLNNKKLKYKVIKPYDESAATKTVSMGSKPRLTKRLL